MRKKTAEEQVMETTHGIEHFGAVTEVWVSTDVKLSKNYQSVGQSFGIRATVRDGKRRASIDGAIAALNRRVDKALEKRLPQMQALLSNAGE